MLTLYKPSTGKDRVATYIGFTRVCPGVSCDALMHWRKIVYLVDARQAAAHAVPGWEAPAY
jgi:hypothetical protein